MKQFINNFLLFIQFFTRIPVNKSLICEKKNFRSGAIFFPVIGLIIGGMQFILTNLLFNYLPFNILAVLVVMVPVIATGALHLDGLGDLCDGFYAFKGGKDRIIEIMKDSTIGTFACAAIVFDILLRYTTMLNLIQYKYLSLIILVPVISRFTIVLLAFIGKNAKETGTGNIFIGNIDLRTLVIAFIITFGIGFLLFDIITVSVLILLSCIITIIFNKYCEFKIGGLTGDLLGANNEIIEMFLLIVGLVLLR